MKKWYMADSHFGDDSKDIMYMLDQKINYNDKSASLNCWS